MRDVGLVVVPYDASRREVRMGRGPGVLLAPIRQTLERAGLRSSVTVVESEAPFAMDAAIMFELARLIRAAVAEVRGRGAFPIVVAGNCASTLGVVPALGSGTAVLWYDSHADFNTADTTLSGFLDGTALATLTGRCFHALAATIPGWAPVRDDQVALVGARQLDPAEVALLGPSAITRVDSTESIDGALGHLAAASRFHLHFDLDVLDISVGRANYSASAGGLTLEMMRAHAARVVETGKLASLAITAYDPGDDPEGRVVGAACDLVRALV